VIGPAGPNEPDRAGGTIILGGECRNAFSQSPVQSGANFFAEPAEFPPNNRE